MGQDGVANKSLRDRFGIPETSFSSSSRLIKEAINKHLLKVLDLIPLLYI